MTDLSARLDRLADKAQRCIELDSLMDMTPEDVAALVKVAQAAEALSHFIWEEMDERDPTDEQMNEGYCALIHVDVHTRHEALADGLASALAALDVLLAGGDQDG